jgi:hypothetical protein
VFTKGTYYSEYEMLAWVVQELLFVDCIGCSRAYHDDLVSHFSDVKVWDEAVDEGRKS